MKLSWSNTGSILVILIPQKVTLCVSTEKHGEGFHKDVDAGKVCLTSQSPELQEPTASDPTNNTVVWLCVWVMSVVQSFNIIV